MGSGVLVKSLKFLHSLVVMVGAGVMSTSCLIDDHVCGERLVEDGEGACVCPEGRVLSDGDCKKCGRHEEAVDNTCTCEDGYSRSSQGDCEPVTEDVTDSSQECEGSDCDQEETAGATEDPECIASSECDEDELCDVFDTGTCIPHPEGLGDECSSSDDCAGTEAEYCEVFSTRTCQIEGCKERGGVCPGDMSCCDFAILSASLCVPADNLEGGQCPAPGQLVPRDGAE